MANADTIRTLLGITGNLISFSIFLAPARSFYKICKRRSVAENSVFPRLLKIVSCAMWMAYGLPFVNPNCILVSTINAIGLCIEITYTLIYFIYWGNMKAWLKMAGTFIMLFSVYAFVIHQGGYRFVGFICIDFNVVMHMFQLPFIVRVLREESVKCIPLGLSLASLAEGLIWTAYGAIHFDINLVIPNGIGATLAACHLILYFIYYKSTNLANDDDQKALMDKEQKLCKTVTIPLLIASPENSEEEVCQKEEEEEEEEMVDSVQIFLDESDNFWKKRNMKSYFIV